MIGAVIILVICVILYFFTKSGSSVLQPSSSNGGEASQIMPGTPKGLVIASGNTIQIGTTQGIVTVNNFYKNIVASEGEILVLGQNANYQITYDTENSSFYIDVLASVTNVAAQNDAESAFLSLLGVSKADACKLDVHEGFSDVHTAAANEPTLSFCGFSAAIH